MKRRLERKLEEQGCAMAMEHLRLLAKGRFLGDDAIVRECQVVKGSKLLLFGCEGEPENAPENSPEVAPEAHVEEAKEGDDEEAEACLDVIDEWEDPDAEPLERLEQANKTRCWACSKRIGLTGVECRCGYLYCSLHRYAESHECDFDHQAHHRSILERQLLGDGGAAQ